jgi:hypothetical protein
MRSEGEKRHVRVNSKVEWTSNDIGAAYTISYNIQLKKRPSHVQFLVEIIYIIAPHEMCTQFTAMIHSI